MAAADPSFDVLGIGNAIVDVLAPVEAGYPEANGMVPGSMSLIDAQQASALLSSIQPVQHTGGGSVANSCVVARALGARVAYLGKVADDEAGAHFRRDLEAIGISFSSEPFAGAAAEGLATARCIILVTPDGQRTMHTYLGACTRFGPADVLPGLVRAAAVTYLEGYLFDPPAAQDAFRLAAGLAHEAGREVALSLSDPFCVGRHRSAFRQLLQGGTDILFANQDEVMSLYETGDFEQAAAQAGSEVALAVLTRSEQGSVILQRGVRTDVPAEPTRVVDSTGAGDAYAAGFLAGYTRGLPMAECGRIGAIAASEVISHFGARPLADLRQMLGL